MFLFQRVTVGVPYLSCISASRDLSGKKKKKKGNRRVFTDSNK